VTPAHIEDLEIDLLLEGMYRRFGQDFRGYRRDVVRRRLHGLMDAVGVSTVSALQDRVMHDEAAAGALPRALCARAAALFDEPGYFLALREKVVPLLRSSPSPKIWVAECTAAEDVGALSILLAEEGLQGKTQIFATAADDALLQEVRSGGFPLERWPEYAANYRESGGKADLADYCREENGRGVFRDELRSDVTWAQYNLATDASFNEFQLIVCRRALRDFGTGLHRRALQLFFDSMPLFGILSVDAEDGLRAAPVASRYKPIAQGQGLYRRVA